MKEKTYGEKLVEALGEELTRLIQLAANGLAPDENIETVLFLIKRYKQIPSQIAVQFREQTGWLQLDNRINDFTDLYLVPINSRKMS